MRPAKKNIVSKPDFFSTLNADLSVNLNFTVLNPLFRLAAGFHQICKFQEILEFNELRRNFNCLHHSADFSRTGSTMYKKLSFSSVGTIMAGETPVFSSIFTVSAGHTAKPP